MRIVIVCVAILACVPSCSYALFIDSNFQCPPGGVVGQPCQDNTNGYVTKGKCNSIYVCVANQLPSQKPKSCLSSPGSPDCPVGSQQPSSMPMPQQPSMDTVMIPVSSLPAGMADALADIFKPDASGTPPIGTIATSAESVLIQIADSGERTEGSPLHYSAASFDPRSSALFAALRDSAVALNAKSRVQLAPTSSPTRIGYPSIGGFGGPYGGESGKRQTETENASSWVPEWLFDVLDFWSRLISACVHLLKAIGYILLADFSVAGTEWEAMKSVIF